MNKILKGAVGCIAILTATATVNAQSFGQYLNDAEHVVKGNGGGSSISNLTSGDIASGLKQALQVGAQNAGKQLSSLNGYFGNQLIKILVPPEAQKVTDRLRDMGLGDKVDQAILSMNRAAEDAATKAVPIFINAITSMSIEDGINILKGNKDAATQYLKAKTTIALTAAFKPVIQQSLDKVDATKYWNDIFRTYNQIPFVSKVNPDLPSYVTDRALSGLFVTIAQEEAKIRQNPAARTTELLQKVFGAK